MLQKVTRIGMSCFSSISDVWILFSSDPKVSHISAMYQPFKGGSLLGHSVLLEVLPIHNVIAPLVTVVEVIASHMFWLLKFNTSKELLIFPNLFFPCLLVFVKTTDSHLDAQVLHLLVILSHADVEEMPVLSLQHIPNLPAFLYILCSSLLCLRLLLKVIKFIFHAMENDVLLYLG